jgi:hypothetical protein
VYVRGGRDEPLGRRDQVVNDVQKEKRIKRCDITDKGLAGCCGMGYQKGKPVRN